MGCRGGRRPSEDLGVKSSYLLCAPWESRGYDGVLYALPPPMEDSSSFTALPYVIVSV